MKTRPYIQGRRAEAAAQTGTRILDAAVELFLEQGDQPTLDAVAARAVVTVQTILRRFGSKEGLFQAGLAAGRQKIVDARDQAPVGDVPGAVANLLGHYGEWGTVSLRLLAIEPQSPAAAAAAQSGRALHRAWCERVFAPFLTDLSPTERGIRLVQLVAATDVYVWKLVHQDLEHSTSETAAILIDLIGRILGEKASDGGC